MTTTLCEHGEGITTASLCADCHHCESDHAGACILSSKGCRCQQYAVHTGAVRKGMVVNRVMGRIEVYN